MVLSLVLYVLSNEVHSTPMKQLCGLQKEMSATPGNKRRDRCNVRSVQAEIL